MAAVLLDVSQGRCPHSRLQGIQIASVPSATAASHHSLALSLSRLAMTKNTQDKSNLLLPQDTNFTFDRLC